jgi:hypothetical protein
MTHPARLAAAKLLRDRHPELDLRVVVDPAPGQEGGSLRTARLAWAAVAPDATHHIVVQDDTVLCRDFADRVAEAVTARPGQAVCLYTEWGSDSSYAVRLAALTGAGWADVIDDYVPTQALVLPAELARGFGMFTDYIGPHDDHAMHRYLARVGVAAHVTVPNLVEDARLPSVMGHDVLGDRASVCFLDHGPGRAAWTAVRRDPTTVPSFLWTVGQPCCVTRTDPPGNRWRRMRPYVAPPGVVTADMVDLGGDAIRRRPELTRAIGSRLLLALWATAFQLGAVAASLLDRGWPARPDPDLILSTPAARRALATMPRGSLRFLVDERRLAAHDEALVDLVQRGVRRGYGARSAGPDQHAVEETS